MRLSNLIFNPDCAVGAVARRRKPQRDAKFEAILCRKHIHKYVEKQNREIPTSRDKDFQAAVDVYRTIWVKY